MKSNLGKLGTCEAFGHKATLHEENSFCDGWVASTDGIDIGRWLTEAGFGGTGRKTHE